MTYNEKENGFTLVELMLAMGFIAFMLLFMVSAILQVTRMYVKGMAIRQINQTGRLVVEDVSSSLRNGSGFKYVKNSNRVCVGNMSYVWNKNGEVINKFSGETATTSLRFVSVQDVGGSLCEGGASDDVSKANSTDMTGPDITVLDFTITTDSTQPLATLSLILSTAGSNVANGPGQPTPTGYACPADNQFCALGDFSTTVYTRGGDGLW